jgi:hypothetical protein
VTLPIDRVLARLEGVTANGSGFQAKCPAHDDRNPSLSVGEGLYDRVLLKCHAGCSVGEIVAGLGLDLRDLFQASPREDEEEWTPAGPHGARPKRHSGARSTRRGRRRPCKSA